MSDLEEIDLKVMIELLKSGLLPPPEAPAYTAQVVSAAIADLVVRVTRDAKGRDQ